MDYKYIQYSTRKIQFEVRGEMETVDLSQVWVEYIKYILLILYTSWKETPYMAQSSEPREILSVPQLGIQTTKTNEDDKQEKHIIPGAKTKEKCFPHIVQESKYSNKFHGSFL